MEQPAVTAGAPRRVAVVGASGSGKSTLARRLATLLDTEQVELDAIYHQANWQPLDAAELRERVGAIVKRDRWVIDGNAHLAANGVTG